MAIFPALIALVGLYGLLFDPQQVTEQVAAMRGVLPPQAADILLQELMSLTQMDRSSLGVGAIVATLFALWSASAGMRTTMQALNVAYDEEEKRGTILFYATALALTLGAIGAVFATAMWLFGSALFSLYVSQFGNYNKTYGSMAAVVILLTWFLLTAYVLLIGAEINAEVERLRRGPAKSR
jgi:membrane protein